MSSFTSAAETVIDALVESGFDIDQYDYSAGGFIEYVKTVGNDDQVVITVDYGSQEVVRKRYNAKGSEVASEVVALSNTSNLNRALALVS